jgi:hypothetical protein
MSKDSQLQIFLFESSFMKLTICKQYMNGSTADEWLVGKEMEAAVA